MIVANKLIGDLTTWAINDDGLGNLPDDVLQACLANLNDVIKRGREILSGRKQAAKAPRSATHA